MICLAICSNSCCRLRKSAGRLRGDSLAVSFKGVFLSGIDRYGLLQVRLLSTA